MVASPSGTKLWVHHRPIAYVLLEGLAIHIISVSSTAALSDDDVAYFRPSDWPIERLSTRFIGYTL
jgi:hypothetical protein